MKVFKFGGASVKDASGVKNTAKVLEAVGCNDIIMVVSAMGKTTNAFEEGIKLYFENSDYQQKLNQILNFHLDIISELFESGHQVFTEVEDLFDELTQFLQKNKSPNYDFVYDQTVPYGELLSTKIVSHYLNQVGIENQWLDVREYIKTDDTYRESKVDMNESKKNLEKLTPGKFYLTQGFIGSDSNYFTTTLGREGSDYSAAIIAHCLDAEDLTIWKDVEGVLNADPRYFENPILLKSISYQEAIELAFYGASVIHPKTLQPLKQKEIPFFVKSFLNPHGEGTRIQNGMSMDPDVPCYILKKNQQLLTLTTRDFSFITEDKISRICSLLHHLKIKVNLMQNSAITFSLCVEDKFLRLEEFMNEIRAEYLIECEKDVCLYTVRNFENKSVPEPGEGEELLRQIIKNTLQLIKKWQN
ncbi:MAG: aspartate kinase [Weeksellaceae bacterium]|nr:aspartate kinase [Weeksellaceae bacterium]